MTIGDRNGHAFPPVSPALARGTFGSELAEWRANALEWIESGAVSNALANVLRWLLGAPGTKAPSPPFSAYQLGVLDIKANAVDVLVWRSSVVSFLSDVWDTIGPARLEMEECQLAIDELFTPHALRGKNVCPDCLEALPEDSKLAGAHYFVCPIRRQRES